MLKKCLQELLYDFSIELTPNAFWNFSKKYSDLRDVLSERHKVFITFLSRASFAETLRATEAILAQGRRAVLHLPVRNMRSKEELSEGLARFYALGGRDILLLAGALEDSVSPFKDSLALLESGLLEAHDWSSIAFAAHPEGHPFITEKQLVDALLQKKDYAKAYPRDYYLVSQFCFDAKAIVRWRKMVLEQGIDFPIHVGVAGLSNTLALIRHAKACGVGDSIAFLKKNTSIFYRLFKGDMSDPSAFLLDLAKHITEEDCGDNWQVHVYPLGNFVKTCVFFNRLAAGDFILSKKGIRFEN